MSLSKKFLSPYFVLLFVLALTPSLAHAHIGVGQTTGFAHGLMHPLFGLDHMVAMVAVGLWASQCGGRALWALPASFLMTMIAGGIVGATGMAFPLLEVGIVLSLVVLGLMLSFQVRMPVLLASAVVGVFAWFHGFAHGAEMPVMASGMVYGLGFVVATATLHGVGIAVGLAAQQMKQPKLIQAAGLTSVLFGVLLFAL